MNAFIDRHPLLARALPSPAHSPLGQCLRRSEKSDTPESDADNQERLNVKHATIGEMMHTARQDGGQLIHDQLSYLWPKASAHDLALAASARGWVARARARGVDE